MGNSGLVVVVVVVIAMTFRASMDSRHKFAPASLVGLVKYPATTRRLAVIRYSFSCQHPLRRFLRLAAINRNKLQLRGMLILTGWRGWRCDCGGGSVSNANLILHELVRLIIFDEGTHWSKRTMRAVLTTKLRKYMRQNCEWDKLRSLGIASARLDVLRTWLERESTHRLTSHFPNLSVWSTRVARHNICCESSDAARLQRNVRDIRRICILQ